MRRSAIGLSVLAVGLLVGCTSLGHQGRAEPKVAEPISGLDEVGFDGDEHELALAVERVLKQNGVKVRLLAAPEVRVQSGDEQYRYKEVQTRYVVRVRSEDLDKCIPEGSRQMNFSITVIDYQERNRVFLQNGEHGCRDTIVKFFADWLTASRARTGR
jgi:hypothetical protein